MFNAINDQGELQSLYTKTKAEIDSCRQKAYYCPSCEEPLQIRSGPRVTAHFAHFPNSDCHRGETLEHETGKWLLYKWTKHQGLHSELEKFLPEIRQRPDVWLTINNKQVAIEYQCATISEKEIRKRTSAYLSSGIFPLWVLGHHHLKYSSKKTLKLTPFLSSFLYHFHDQYFLYFFNPQECTISVASRLRTTSPRVCMASIQCLSLHQMAFPDLFQSSPEKPLYSAVPFWEKLWYSHRTTYKKHVSTEERQFRQYVYLKGFHFSLIPSVCYLPVEGQITMKEKPFIWQTRLLMEYFLYVPMGGRVRFPVLKGRPTTNGYYPDVAYEYLKLLQSLGYVCQQSNNTWIKTKEVYFHRHVDQAIEEDQKIMHALKKLHRI
ncbi:hypothetical protein H0266_06120 [Halobacillus locisalis]|uniref:Competence protein CoiA n=1 Tax=Halobacillus locisalis TaxID=220753 RepID=A0A838CR97_9BACI|nr:hypothetical protein [Halobacillus locisalis]